ncbi:hypothetical protein C8J56DRAFT_38101 [Mycena floridula]|nr:hypothetical protein C8J56DRAFT_38101 [Mycena floridula]
MSGDHDRSLTMSIDFNFIILMVHVVGLYFLPQTTMNQGALRPVAKLFTKDRGSKTPVCNNCKKAFNVKLDHTSHEKQLRHLRECLDAESFEVLREEEETWEQAQAARVKDLYLRNEGTVSALPQKSAMRSPSRSTRSSSDLNSPQRQIPSGSLLLRYGYSVDESEEEGDVEDLLLNMKAQSKQSTSIKNMEQSPISSDGNRKRKDSTKAKQVKAPPCVEEKPRSSADDESEEAARLEKAIAEEARKQAQIRQMNANVEREHQLLKMQQETRKLELLNGKEKPLSRKKRLCRCLPKNLECSER